MHTHSTTSETRSDTFKRMTSSHIIIFVIEFESTICKSRILQYILVMARQNSWQVSPDKFWNPVNRYKNCFHKIHRLALHVIWLSKAKTPQNIIISYIVLPLFSNFSHCPNKLRAIPKHSPNPHPTNQN